MEPPSLLLQTAACSVKALLRPSGERVLSSNLRSNFAHLMAGRPSALPTIETFVCSVSRALGVNAIVVVTSLIYVERLSARLPRSATGNPDSPYRIFLAALLLADKYWSDRAVKVMSLVAATGGLFRHREILAMERALLRILAFDLYVSAEHIRGFAANLGIDIDATLSKPL
ncbi:hypothetical protein IWQ57_000010 [Coemansia nantahalensis]|uniref:Uncharacterized protein n=2 Tax=Coemansia TaxID=4863 RepID=A0ACC1K8H3_9FUNG|nr:hypothetical protein IWQ57_000010 [Coemansia nantahalensis]